MKEIKKENTILKNIADADQICIVNNKTGEILPSNEMTALRDFERISKRNPDFSLFFPADQSGHIR